MRASSIKSQEEKSRGSAAESAIAVVLMFMYGG